MRSRRTFRPGRPVPLHRRFQDGDVRELELGRSALWIFVLSDVPELGHSFLSFPDFLWATARVIPMRSGLRVFCFPGSSPKSMRPSHKADASLRLHAPSLSVVPKENGAERKGENKCLI